MRLVLRAELAFTTANLTFRGTTIAIPDVLVDTGAASTVLNADLASEAGVVLERSDRLRVVRGVGDREVVFVRRVENVAIGGHGIDDFEVEVGEMDYGFAIGGILGMDFLCAAGAVIDLHRRSRSSLRSAPHPTTSAARFEMLRRFDMPRGPSARDRGSSRDTS